MGCDELNVLVGKAGGTWPGEPSVVNIASTLGIYLAPLNSRTVTEQAVILLTLAGHPQELL